MIGEEGGEPRTVQRTGAWLPEAGGRFCGDITPSFLGVSFLLRTALPPSSPLLWFNSQVRKVTTAFWSAFPRTSFTWSVLSGDAGMLSLQWSLKCW
jgi:hypothetical protein